MELEYVHRVTQRDHIQMPATAVIQQLRQHYIVWLDKKGGGAFVRDGRLFVHDSRGDYHADRELDPRERNILSMFDTLKTEFERLEK